MWMERKGRVMSEAGTDVQTPKTLPEKREARKEPQGRGEKARKSPLHTCRAGSGTRGGKTVSIPHLGTLIAVRSVLKVSSAGTY